MRIRRAQASDLDALCDMRVAFLAGHRRVDPHTLSQDFVTETRSFLIRTQGAGSMHSWLAEQEGGYLGLVSVLLHPVPPVPEDALPHEGYIINLYVDPSVRHQGVGRLLLETCLASAPALGIRRFQLHATPDAKRLYLRAGFESNDDRLEIRTLPGP